jgi:hypothetical protein
VVISIGAAAFWIAVAAVLIAGSWSNVRRAQIKQEALLRLIEKTGTIDEAQVKLLFPPPGPLPPHWFQPPDRLAGQRALRVGGTILLAIAAGLAVFFTILLNFGSVAQQAAAIPGFGAASLVACIGLGLLVGSRFATGPVETSRE